MQGNYFSCVTVLESQTFGHVKAVTAESPHTILILSQRLSTGGGTLTKAPAEAGCTGREELGAANLNTKLQSNGQTFYPKQIVYKHNVRMPSL